MTTRRDFLTRLGLGALVGAVAPKVLAAEPESVKLATDVIRVSQVTPDTVTFDADIRWTRWEDYIDATTTDAWVAKPAVNPTVWYHGNGVWREYAP
jgi:hypothetical protein